MMTSQVPLRAARQDDSHRGRPHARRRPLHQGHRPPLLRRHAAEAPAPASRPSATSTRPVAAREEEDDGVQVHAGEGSQPGRRGDWAHHVGRGCVPQRRAALLDRRGRGRLQARGILSEYQRWTMEPAAPTLKEAPKQTGDVFFQFFVIFLLVSKN
jgi:hypothetical protein